MTNRVHETALIDDQVSLGNDNVILPYTVLTGPLKIGDNNIIGPHVVIGSPGEDTRNPRYDSAGAEIEIGSHNIIREFTAVQKPAYRDATVIGSHTFLMHGVHVPHDAVLEDRVTVAPLVVIGGIAHLMEGANLGMGCTIHQYSIIGSYSIVATGAAATKNVRPFSRFIPGQGRSVNLYAVEKFGFGKHTEEITRYVLDDEEPTSGVVSDVVARYRTLHEASGRREY